MSRICARSLIVRNRVVEVRKRSDSLLRPGLDVRQKPLGVSRGDRTEGPQTIQQHGLARGPGGTLLDPLRRQQWPVAGQRNDVMYQPQAESLLHGEGPVLAPLGKKSPSLPQISNGLSNCLYQIPVDGPRAPGGIRQAQGIPPDVIEATVHHENRVCMSPTMPGSEKDVQRRAGA